LQQQAPKPASSSGSQQAPKPANKLTFSLGEAKALAPDWKWVKPVTGSLIHLLAELKTDVALTVCNLSLAKKSTLGEGAKAATATGRKLCQTCWKRTEQPFRELVAQLWPALEPDEVIIG
jgi:hypothetical protein